ncbi:MAG: LVIVD repeat-containing protein [Actinomycetota bacterium]
MQRIVGLALAALLSAALGAGVLPAPARATVVPGRSPAPAAVAAAAPGSFELVGHDPLMNRGMNAALAVRGDYAYVGSRTDGTHPNAGVMVVNVADPSAPEVVGQIGPANRGETSREMRIWPEQDLLIVLYLASNCSFIIHACSPEQMTKDDVIRFYDIAGDRAAAPELIAEYLPSQNPHEFYLWQDPDDRKRALLYMSTPGGSDQMMVTDISRARAGKFTELVRWKTVIPESGDNRLHSLSLSTDGRRAFLAYLQGGFFVIDTSELATGKSKPRIKAVTPIHRRVHWEGPGAHSAVKLFGRPYALVTDEVYGQIPGLLPNHGCPWGWTRLISIKNPVKPKVVAEYRTEANEPEYCESADNSPDRQSLSSQSAHNPTLTRNLAFITWHSQGLQAISVKNPARPVPVAEFVPTPEPVVVQEDPVLSSGRDKVVMWSYPVVKDGLIYVVDVRNGLYILRYKGPFAAEVSATRFLEGNSNLGDALRFEPPR